MSDIISPPNALETSFRERLLAKAGESDIVVVDGSIATLSDHARREPKHLVYDGSSNAAMPRLATQKVRYSGGVASEAQYQSSLTRFKVVLWREANSSGCKMPGCLYDRNTVVVGKKEAVNGR